MAILITIPIILSATDTDLILQAQLVNESGTDIGDPIIIGFTEDGGGRYSWLYPLSETFRGRVDFSILRESPSSSSSFSSETWIASLDESSSSSSSFSSASSISATSSSSTQSDDPVVIYSVSLNIANGAPEFVGNFIRGQAGALYFRLMSLDGTPIDADEISVLVQDVNGVIVFNETPQKITTGFYMYDWLISSDATVGDYRVFWSYITGGVVSATYQTFVVSAAGTATAYLLTRYTGFRNALENLMPVIQSIPIYHEQAKVSTDNRTYRFTFPRWNQPSPPNVYRNTDIPLTSGYTIDFLKGEVTFDASNLAEDIVYADYNFRFFTEEQLRLFITNGINDYNTYAPHTRYDWMTLPDQYTTPALYSAVVNALRTYQQALMWPQYRVLFESDKLADRQVEWVESEIKGYTERFEKLAEQKKNFPYVGLTRLIFQPMFSLPGGRARFFRMMFGGNS